MPMKVGIPFVFSRPPFMNLKVERSSTPVRCSLARLSMELFSTGSTWSDEVEPHAARHRPRFPRWTWMHVAAAPVKRRIARAAIPASPHGVR
jgi:hypothetical protein